MSETKNGKRNSYHCWFFYSEKSLHFLLSRKVCRDFANYFIYFREDFIPVDQLLMGSSQIGSKPFLFRGDLRNFDTKYCGEKKNKTFEDL